MRNQLAPPLSRPPVPLSWRLLLLVSVPALAALTGGLLTLIWHQRSESPDVLRAPSAIVLLLTGLIQARLAWRLAQQGVSPLPRQRPYLLVRRLCVGLVLCYLATLALGSGPSAPGVLAAASMTWLTALLLPLTANPDTIEQWRGLLQGRGPRIFARCLYVALLLVVAGELLLQAGGRLGGRRLLEGARPLEVTSIRRPPGELSLAGGTSRPAEPTDSQGRRGLRVAVMGDDVAIDAAGRHQALAQLELHLPALEVLNLSGPDAGLHEYAHQGIQQACELEPDLVLTFVSVADDIVNEPATTNLFDWHTLWVPRVAQRLIGWPARDEGGRLSRTELEAGAPASGWEGYVAACGPQLTVCRKPIDATMQRRWKTALAQFDELAERCRAAKIPLALVIVPSPLQTNRALLEAVCRRQGCSMADVDLELPQRRLAAYAAEQRLPALDLLPALRLSPEQPYVHQGLQWNELGNEIAAQALSGWLKSTFAATLAAHEPAAAPVAASGKNPLLIARQQ